MDFSQTEYITELRDVLGWFLDAEAPREALSKWDKATTIPLHMQERFADNVSIWLRLDDCCTKRLGLDV